MSTLPKHIPFATLADFAEGRVSEEAQAAAMAHISACSRCASNLQQLGRAIELMRTDSAEDAPRDLVARAVSIMSQQAGETEPSLVRRIVAALKFDSLTLAPAFGVRSAQAPSRQLLFSAEEQDVDLRIRAQNDQYVVSGQVLGENCAGGEVEIIGEGGSLAASLNELCEFTLPAVPAGSYALRLRLRGTDVDVPGLELRA